MICVEEFKAMDMEGRYATLWQLFHKGQKKVKLPDSPAPKPVGRKDHCQNVPERLVDFLTIYGEQNAWAISRGLNVAVDTVREHAKRLGESGDISVRRINKNGVSMLVWKVRND